MAEIDETIKRIQANKGVTGIIILNNDGIPLRTTMNQESTVSITGHIHNLVHKARNTVRELDSQNDLTFLRLRSKKHEIMCAPENDYMMVVIQTPSIVSG
ncbi:dynein light chain roadblock-type 2-like [Babylonia areolata]|uniref:dynein light chain roadblock-type 2-like n=1 Tax=Babylonia areolata TaxID=304850 RepID=UPI003FD0FEA6